MLPSAQEVTLIEQKQPVLPSPSKQKGVYAQEESQPTAVSIAVSAGVETIPGTAAVGSERREPNSVAMWDQEQRYEEHSARMVEIDKEGGRERRFISQAELTAHRLTDEGRYRYLMLDTIILLLDSVYLPFPVQRGARNMCLVITLWVSLPCVSTLRTLPSRHQRMTYATYLGDILTGHLKTTETCACI